LVWFQHGHLPRGYLAVLRSPDRSGGKEERLVVDAARRNEQGRADVRKRKPNRKRPQILYGSPLGGGLTSPVQPRLFAFPWFRGAGLLLKPMDAPLKKVVTVCGQRVELFSIDGTSWSSDLKQLEKRMKEKAKEQAKILGEAKKFLRSRAGLAERTSLSHFERRGMDIQEESSVHQQVEMVRRFSRLSAR
jgi:hypothetical protein